MVPGVGPLVNPRWREGDEGKGRLWKDITGGTMGRWQQSFDRKENVLIANGVPWGWEKPL